MKTVFGVAHFRVGEAPPVCVFVKTTPGRQKPFWVLLAFASGKHHPCGFSSKSCRDGKNLFGCCSLLRWGSTTRRRFACPDAFSAKTRGVFVVPTCFWQKCAAFCLSRRDFCQNAWRFIRPDVFLAKTRRVFVVPTCFPPKRGAFYSPRCNFCENARHIPCLKAKDIRCTVPNSCLGTG